jgi:hypothetical protein
MEGDFWSSLLASLLARENQIRIAVVVLGTIGAFFVRWHFARRKDKREKDAQLREILKNAPDVSYSWDCNFAELKLRLNGNVEDAASRLSGTFTIRNGSDKALYGLHVLAVIGYDRKIATKAYSADAGGQEIHLPELPNILPGKSASIDILEAARHVGIELKAIFTDNFDFWAKHENADRLRRPLNNDAAVVKIQAGEKLEDAFYSEKYLFIDALYVRIVVRYEHSGILYSHVFTVVLGKARPRPKSGADLRLFFAYCDKQGLSTIQVGAGRPAQTVLMPQKVDNNFQRTHAKVPDFVTLTLLTDHRLTGSAFTSALITGKLAPGVVPSVKNGRVLFKKR